MKWCTRACREQRECLIILCSLEQDFAATFEIHYKSIQNLTIITFQIHIYIPPVWRPWKSQPNSLPAAVFCVLLCFLPRLRNPDLRFSSWWNCFSFVSQTSLFSLWILSVFFGIKHSFLLYFNVLQIDYYLFWPFLEFSYLFWSVLLEGQSHVLIFFNLITWEHGTRHKIGTEWMLIR